MYTPLRIDDSLVLDPRKAVWFPRDRTLAVADLHLGYSWIHRTAGNLLPVGISDDTAARLVHLVEEYRPMRLVVLGDIVHRAAPIPALVEALSGLLKAVEKWCLVTLLAGNHDAALGGLLARCQWRGELMREWYGCDFILMHGDADADASKRLACAKRDGRRIVIGHEHPAIRLGDGVATSAKCPCFLLGDALVILPAFSSWAAGTDFRKGEWLSQYATATRFHTAVAIMGKRLLPIPLQSESRSWKG